MNPLPWLIGLSIVVVGMALWADHHDSNVCASKGGHIVEKSTVGTGISMNGNVSVVPVTVTFCISQDGRILE